MNNSSVKRIAIGTMAVFVAALAFYFYNKSGDAKPTPNFINAAFGEHIASYTAGVISSDSPIKIILARDAVDSSFIGKESVVKLFEFEPSVKGKATWVDRQTIEFRPESKMESGRIYKSSFFLSKALDVPRELATFNFSFQVIPQNFEVSIDNIKAYEKTLLKRQRIEGTLSTADIAEPALVEKMISPTQDGRKLSVNWIHSDGGRQHHFTIEDVERKNSAGKVSIAVQGGPLGVERSESKEIEIPSLDDFKLMNTRVVQNPNQHVILQFSDPLKEKQNLQGLITIPGVERLDFSIHDNEITVYPSARQDGNKTIRLEAGIRNILDYRTKDPANAEVVFEQLAPAVRFTGNGSILPATDGLVLPFEAVNLNAVDVTVFKIFQGNIMQFLQVNNFDGNSELYRVGKRVIKRTLALNTSGVTDLGRWNRFTLNLSDIIQQEPGAIYQIKLGFKKSYSTYNCSGEIDDVEFTSQFDEEDDESQYGYEGYYEEDYYYYEDYDWEQRDNPCHSSYFTSNRFIRKNIFASDLGILAKHGDDGNTVVFVTDLRTTQPVSGVQVELYNFQQQVIGTANTGGDGRAEIKSKENPFVLLAKNGSQRGYLKMHDGESLSISNFDVSGEAVQKGLKGFLYGDRGVWRPGDSLHLTFVLEDRLKQLPDNHPLIFEMQNPQGQVVNRIVRSSSENGFYSFATATSPDAPTGNWTGRVKAGGLNYTQTLKIETVKPNRLKINLDFGTERFTTSMPKGELSVNWLHGAVGRNLKAEFDMTMVSVPTTFAKYNDFSFEDPSRSFSSEPVRIFEGETDDEGKAGVEADLSSGTAAPGFVNVVFRGKVFEESGNFSTDRFSIPFLPYNAYVGMRTPPGEKYSGILYFDQPHKIDLVTVDRDGRGVSRTNLEISLFKLNWRWWWDNSYDGIANYVNGTYSKLLKKDVVNTTEGKGAYTLNLKKDEYEYGRYYIRACDPASGHCTGQIIYVDEPGWYSRARDTEAGAPNILTVETDKEKYNIGEKVNLTIPTNNKGKALVSIENGTRVLKTYWIEANTGETKFTFDATADMTPNVYVHVTFLQPHAQTTNELPIRLYGVKGIGVEDPSTHLEPVINMPDELEPGQKVSITISEKTKRKMTYTIAVVDEGLLDITRFKTPDAWNRFYSKEALGVKTWDLYDHVIGAFGARLERVLTIGGDGEAGGTDEDPRANRFKPVVKFFGPFTLDGGRATHSFIMPEYIGSVKTMVVAGFDGAYGKAEKVTPVRKPLMVLATLPRVLGPQESVKLPVTIFTQDKNIRNVRLEVKASGPLSMTGESVKTVRINGSGDVTIDFDVLVAPATGVGSITVTASAGSLSAKDAIEIDIRNPNLPVTKVVEGLVENGKSWQSEVMPFGIAGSNTAMLEVSSLPPINLGQRLRYLMQYPYGCIEQTTSAVFSQLYLDNVKVLTDNEKLNIQRNVTAGIERLKSFVRRDGGFSYWPGADDADSWSTSYAGHFLFEASSKGYYVPDDLLKRWKKFQKNKVEEWRREAKYNNDLQQAYRLYTLALAGSPEIGAMNRLREDSQLSASSVWMLAAAYAKAGQPEAARKLVDNRDTNVKEYRELAYTYGSDFRDRALILETLVLLNEKSKAFEVVKELSRRLSDPNGWLSTQETAMALRAIGNFAGLEKRGDLRFANSVNGKTTEVVSAKPVSQIPIPINALGAQKVAVTNSGGGLLFARLIMEGTPARGDEEAAQNNLFLKVRYTDMRGIDIDVSALEQGTQFVAEVSVTASGVRSYYENLALSQVFPPGWEINNLRLNDDNGLLKTDAFNYQDIRDDRVYTYFGFSPNERRTYRILLTASYAGKYYLPAISCEAMYDKSIYARTKGMEVEVIKRTRQDQ